MENEIEVGEYIRTKLGDIKKITEGFEFIIKRHNESDNKIVKHSFNIIDLIEEGDYVNGSIVVEILHGDPSVIVENYGEEELFENDIKSIVTKEQFENIKYEVKNKIEVGEYIRTKYGEIAKVIEYIDEIVFNKEIKFHGIYRNYLCKNELDFIVEHSFNIIDLIEVGDVIIVYTDVSKYEVIGKNGEYIETLEDRYITINDIKAILTKEMIENISYKVEK